MALQKLHAKLQHFMYTLKNVIHYFPDDSYPQEIKIFAIKYIQILQKQHLTAN